MRQEMHDTSVSADDVDGDSPRHLGNSASVRGGDVLEEEGVVITPQNIAIQYYRRETLRIATIVILLATVDLFVTPIDAFILLPAAVAASYWLRDTVRFGHGGDLRRCFNRDCSLMYFHVCSGVAVAISALDSAILIVNVSATQGSSGAGGVHAPATTATLAPTIARSESADVTAAGAPNTAGHSVHWYAFAIALNASSCITLLYGLYCTRKLRRLLELGASDVLSTVQQEGQHTNRPEMVV